MPRVCLDCRGRRLVLGERTLVVGILNATPGFIFRRRALAGPGGGGGAGAAHGRRRGPPSSTSGGQSTRPGHAEVTARGGDCAGAAGARAGGAADAAVPVSIDTYKPAVAREALRAGAHLVNDERGFQGDPDMAGVVAEFGCPAVLMHWDRDFPEAPGDPIGNILRFWTRSLGIAAAAGVPESRIILDPGIGFAKTHEQNLEILRRIGELKSLGRPILLGASRKSVIGRVLGGEPRRSAWRARWRLRSSRSPRAWSSCGSTTCLRTSARSGWPRRCWAARF